MTARPARLVLVDDDELLREVLAGNLSQAGFEVTVFSDPVAALAAIPDGDADLMILDWKMPGMSGLELLQALRGRGVARALFEHSVRDEHIYRHVWREHDLVFWDNRSLMHLAAGTPDHLRRKMYRTTIEGDTPF